MSTVNIRSEFEMQIDVQFVDAEKAKAELIDGDWKNHFVTLKTLEDAAGFVASGFHHANETWSRDRKEFIKFVEGIGEFTLQEDGTYCNIGESETEFGRIVVGYEWELENTGNSTLSD